MAKNRTFSVGTALWAKRINVALQNSIEGLLEAGRVLIEAKDNLPHGAYQKMIETELRCDPRTVQRLVAIAKDERIRRSVSHLPASWSTLYELTRLTDAEFEAAIKSGALTAETQRKDVPKLRQPAPIVTDADFEDITEQASADEAGDAAPQEPASYDAATADGLATTEVVTDPPNGGDTEGHEQDAPGAFARESAEAEPAFTPSVSGAGMDTAAAPFREAGGDPDVAGNVTGQPGLMRWRGAFIPTSEGDLSIEDIAHNALAALLHELFPVHKPSTTLDGVRAQFHMLVGNLRSLAATAGQVQRGPSISVDPDNPGLTYETALAVEMPALAKLDLEASAEGFRPPLYSDDLTAHIDRLIKFERHFRATHGAGNRAAVERDAAE